jgi:hypothetical protein
MIHEAVLNIPFEEPHKSAKLKKKPKAISLIIWTDKFYLSPRYTGSRKERHYKAAILNQLT